MPVLKAAVQIFANILTISRAIGKQPLIGVVAKARLLPYDDCRGAMNNKGVWSFGSRRGLLACVYNGVSLTINALVAGNGSYSTAQCP